MNLTQYQKLKTRHDKYLMEATRAEGAIEEIDRRLQKEFNCDATSAETVLKSLEKEYKRAASQFDSALRRFEEKWGALLREEEE